MSSYGSNELVEIKKSQFRIIFLAEDRNRLSTKTTQTLKKSVLVLHYKIT